MTPHLVNVTIREREMHPKRAARIMLLLEMLKKDYGFEDKKDGK